jgi:hypothetical protein
MEYFYDQSQWFRDDRSQFIRDLSSQFSSWTQYDHRDIPSPFHPSHLIPIPLLFMELYNPMQTGDTKGQCFPGSGTGPTNHIASLHDGFKGLGLDGGET